MMTPEEYQKHHTSDARDAGISDREIERIVDSHLRDASSEQELVPVTFDCVETAQRAAQLYQQHWTVAVDRNTIEIRVPRVPAEERRRSVPRR